MFDLFKRDKAPLETDYTDRCGNCHAYMEKTDKYCKYCGTKRGEGRFRPFKNPLYCVYGPPIKKKYRCKKCSHKWYTAALGGGEDSLYCPQCGEKKIELTGTKVLDFGDDPDADEE